MHPIIQALCVIPLVLVHPAAATQPLDTRFLKEEPYRKTKQKVDLSSIRTEHDLAVVKAAINPIMHFMVDVHFTEAPPELTEKLMTEHGRAVLRRAPARNKFNRYSVASMSNWKVCGDKMLSLDATFSDLLRRKFWQEQYLFVETADGWRFDEHTQAQCQSRP